MSSFKSCRALSSSFISKLVFFIYSSPNAPPPPLQYLALSPSLFSQPLIYLPLPLSLHTPPLIPTTYFTFPVSFSATLHQAMSLSMHNFSLVSSNPTFLHHILSLFSRELLSFAISVNCTLVCCPFHGSQVPPAYISQLSPLPSPATSSRDFLTLLSITCKLRLPSPSQTMPTLHPYANVPTHFTSLCRCVYTPVGM